MKLTDIQTTKFKPLLRSALEAANPRHAGLDYRVLFASLQNRASRLWVDEIRPEMGDEACEAFERSLMRVSMRARRAIPWILASGITFGRACQALAGVDEAEADAAALNAGLLMLILGLFDHLLDDYPQELGDMAALVTKEALERWTRGEDLQALRHAASQPVAAGWANLYRLYFARCAWLRGGNIDEPMRFEWRTALQDIHAAEGESLERKRSRVAPSAAIVLQAERPSQAGYRAVALTACLSAPPAALAKVTVLARNYARLTWLVDDVVDIEADKTNDLWSGFGVRLATEVKTQEDADRLVLAIAEECASLLREVYASLGDARWQPDDTFTLADILWAYVWAWLGGDYEAGSDKESGAEATATLLKSTSAR